MKKFLIVFLVLVLSAGIGMGLGWFINGRKVETKTATASKTPVDTKKHLWGVFTNPYVFNTPNDSFMPDHVDKQVSYWKDLGLNIVRFNYEFFSDRPEYIKPENDYLIKKLQANGIKRLMVVESPLEKDFFNLANYQKGYEWGSFIGTHFKGKIDYYQLLNEVSGKAVKENASGYKIEDYDMAKFAPMEEYIKGLSDGIHEADPKAKRVICAHWIGVAAIDKLIADDVNFEVIGWNWFSEMGDDPTNKKLDDGTVLNIPKHFEKSGKEFWLTELNRSSGSFDGKEQDQAQYLKTAMDNLMKSGLVKGVFVYQLFDPNPGDDGKQTPNNQLGIIKVKKDSAGKWGPGEKKPAYSTYKDLIARYL